MVPAHLADGRFHRRVNLPRMLVRPVRPVGQAGQALASIPPQPSVHRLTGVAQGQDGTNSYWLHLDEGRIAVRELPGETLAGVAPSGVCYLDLPHVDTQLAIRGFVDDHIVASCVANEIPGFELHDRPGLDEDARDADGLASWLGPSGYGPNDGAGAYLDEHHVLVGIFTAAYDKDETELHLVLSTRSLRWVATVDYGQYGPPVANSIVPGHDGRWLTYDWRAGVAALWELGPSTREAEPALVLLAARSTGAARSTSSAPARSDVARTYRSAALGCVTARPMIEIRLRRSPTTPPTQLSRR